MVLFLLNIIFFAITTLASLISSLIFTTASFLVVLAIQAFKVPGEAAKGALEQFADVLRSCVEYLAGLAFEALTTLLSALFDVVKDGVLGSVTATGSALGELVEQMRGSIDGLVKESAQQVLEGFSEMVSTIVSDLWSNYKDAVGYVTENA